MATPTWGSNRRDPARQRMINRAKTIKLKELFELPPPERQALINLMVEVRDPGNPDEGFQLRVNPDNDNAPSRLRYQSHPDRDPRELTTTRTRLGVRDAIYVYGKWGDYSQLEQVAPGRHAVVVEYTPPAKTQEPVETEVEDTRFDD